MTAHGMGQLEDQKHGRYLGTFLDRMRSESRHPIFLVFGLEVMIQFRYHIMQPKCSILPKLAQLSEKFKKCHLLLQERPKSRV